jgi:Sec-independent protein translocase protein TatA
MEKNLLLFLGHFMKSVEKMPTGPRLFIIVLLVVSLLLGWFIHRLPSILHEAPATIRALRGDVAGAAPLAAPQRPPR